MEPLDDHHKYPSELSSSSSSCSSSKDHETRALELLEEFWFFENLLMLNNTNKSRNNNMFMRCYSDPFPSPIPFQETPASKTPTEGVGSRRRSKLVRTPSSPPDRGREGHERDEFKLKQKGGSRHEKEIIRSSKNKTIVQPRKNMLTRTQTLPPLMSTEKVEMNQDHHHQQENNNGKIMTKSCRQASFNLADFLPPRHSRGTSRYRSPRTKELVEDIDTDGSKEMRRRYFKGRNLRRSLSELESEEVQGFKDLGFTFDNKDLLSPNVVNILPGLQEKKEEENMGLENKVRRPYLSEAWMVQSAPPTPNWAATRSSKEMKAQIKSWARSVASNVRQEC